MGEPKTLEERVQDLERRMVVFDTAASLARWAAPLAVSIAAVVAVLLR